MAFVDKNITSDPHPAYGGNGIVVDISGQQNFDGDWNQRCFEIPASPEQFVITAIAFTCEGVQNGDSVNLGQCASPRRRRGECTGVADRIGASGVQALTFNGQDLVTGTLSWTPGTGAGIDAAYFNVYVTPANEERYWIGRAYANAYVFFIPNALPATLTLKRWAGTE